MTMSAPSTLPPLVTPMAPLCGFVGAPDGYEAMCSLAALILIVAPVVSKRKVDEPVSRFDDRAPCPARRQVPCVHLGHWPEIRDRIAVNENRVVPQDSAARVKREDVVGVPDEKHIGLARPPGL